MVRVGWGEGSQGHLGNEAASVMAKQAAEGEPLRGYLPLDDHETWMSGRGIRQRARQRKMKYLEGGGRKQRGMV